MDLCARLFFDAGGMLAYFFNNFSPFIFTIGGSIGPRWYGFAYVMAFVCGFLLYKWLAKRGYSGMPPENVGDFITWAALFGVMLGGRLGYVLFYRFDEYASHPLDIFKIWDGGMSSHGGMLGLILFTFYYARRYHLSWTGIGDNLCVVAPIGLFFGRCANFINGELYGRILIENPSGKTLPWGMQFPRELIENAQSVEAQEIHQRVVTKAVSACFGSNPALDDPWKIVDACQTSPAVRAILAQLLPVRHPSQLYEAFLEGIVLFCALWLLRTRVRSPRGVITGAFFIFYALLRIIGENFRVPDAPLTGPLTRGQFLSLFLIVIGALFVIYGITTKHYERADITKMQAVEK
jgi:phosphatidylglycerol:prolipoprotein diacylglycerol transferase